MAENERPPPWGQGDGIERISLDRDSIDKQQTRGAVNTDPLDSALTWRDVSRRVRAVRVALNKAVDSARLGYEFSPGTYTFTALNDVLALQDRMRLLGLDDTDEEAWSP